MAFVPAANYRLRYPFEDIGEQTSWEIDKDEWKFVTVGLQQTTEDDEEAASISEDGASVHCAIDDVDSEADESEQTAQLQAAIERMKLRDRPRYSKEELENMTSGDIWKDMMQDPEFRRNSYISACILNKPAEIRKLVGTSDDNYFAAHDEYERNGIFLAATEGHLRLLQWLQDNGCDKEKPNKRGRTPLMAAALWGRLQVVEHLLSAGVDATLRDIKGRSAYDLALPSRRNTSERERHSHHREPRDADLHRRHIAIKLQSITGEKPPQKPCQSKSRQHRPGIFLEPNLSAQPIFINYLELGIQYPIPDPKKAVGRLDRGPLFPIRPVFASHVEKQLLAFYIAKHVLLDSDNDEAVAQDGEDMDLSLVKPAKAVEGTIKVSKVAMCDNCRNFVKEVKRVVPMELKFENRDGVRV
ncbi:uncharacterized protein KY384_007290 [Bacidia gigantensis]|uniref:uncharacterized protein n=1 Tax=Bacidia gigantensis TaxID=2732470 RepID=UPI001D05661D|nr:uncharacterized protein KY384_007290 [Bacidia gigantensis]KAG8528372.1 hypothetical protein KY384_007290 [Bacidia gigantensis]